MDWESAFVLVTLSVVFVVLAYTIKRLVWVEERIDVERRCRIELGDDIKAMLYHQSDIMKSLNLRIERLEDSNDHD